MVQDLVPLLLCLLSPYLLSLLSVGIVPVPEFLGLAEVLVVAVIHSLVLRIRQAVL